MGDSLIERIVPVVIGALIAMAVQFWLARRNREVNRLERYEKHLDDALERVVAAATEGVFKVIEEPSEMRWNTASGNSMSALLMAGSWARRCGRMGLEDALKKIRERLPEANTVIDPAAPVTESEWIMLQQASIVLVGRSMRDERVVEGPTRNGRDAIHSRAFDLDALLDEVRDGFNR